MYKTIKTMRQALAEARAYRDPVNEDRGFSSQQIKMAYGILNDPRYKQGNYSGAVNAIEKIAKGLSDHPDVANALKRANESLEEGTITEFKKMTVTFKDMDSFAKAYVDLAKKGFKLQGQGLEIKVDGNGADLNKYAADMNNFYGATVKAESLGEAAAGSPSMRISKQDADKFDMAKYKENEKENQHSDNALLLVKKFGTAADYKKIVDIDIRHQKAGHISMADLKTRNDISRKYIGRLI